MAHVLAILTILRHPAFFLVLIFSLLAPGGLAAPSCLLHGACSVTYLNSMTQLSGAHAFRRFLRQF